MKYLVQSQVACAPDTLSNEEKAKQTYDIKCTAMNECGALFPLRLIPSFLDDETFVLMNSRNSALAVHMQKDDIIRKHQQEKETTPENQKQSMRDAYEKCEYQHFAHKWRIAQDIQNTLQPTTQLYLSQDGLNVIRQCANCHHGPLDKSKCDDMAAHHGKALPGQTYVQNNACFNCGFFNRNSFAMWPIWTGEHVYACEPASAPAAPAIDVESIPDYRQLAFDLLDPAGRFEDFDHLVDAGFSEAQVYFEIRDRGYPTITDVGRRRDLWALSILGLL